jgi:hypothetical protein
MHRAESARWRWGPEVTPELWALSVKLVSRDPSSARILRQRLDFWIHLCTHCVILKKVRPVLVKRSNPCTGLEKVLRVPGVWGFQDFWTIGTWRWHGCQPYAPTAFTLEMMVITIDSTGYNPCWQTNSRSTTKQNVDPLYNRRPKCD